MAHQPETPALRTVIAYTLLMSAASVLAFAQMLVFARVLAPAEFGYYGAALTLASVGAFVQCGVLSGVGRELPIALGAHARDRAQRVVAGATVALAVLGCGGLVIWSGVVILLDPDDPRMRLAIILAGLMSVSSLFAQLALVRLRSECDLLGFSVLLFVQRVLVVVAGVTVAPHEGFAAVLGAVVVIDLLVFVCASRLRLTAVSYSAFGRGEVAQLVKVGLPIMAGSALYSLQLSADRIFYLTVATPEQLGLYQIASLPLVAGAALSSIFGQYLHPKWLREFGATGSVEAVFRASAKASVALVLGLCALFPLASIAARLLFEFWLPEYKQSHSALLVLYVGAVFLTANLSGVTLYAANRPMLIVCSTAGTLFLMVPALEIIRRHTTDMIWFAAAGSAGIVVEYVIRLWLARVCVRRRGTCQAVGSSVALEPGR